MYALFSVRFLCLELPVAHSARFVCYWSGGGRAPLGLKQSLDPSVCVRHRVCPCSPQRCAGQLECSRVCVVQGLGAKQQQKWSDIK